MSIPVLVALNFLRSAMAFERDTGLLKGLLVAAKPSVPTVILRDNPTLNWALRSRAKVDLVAQNRLRIAQLVDLQHSGVGSVESPILIADFDQDCAFPLTANL
jgi:hypothetical protein